VAYTESLFGCLTLAGLCCLYCPPGAPPRVSGGTRTPRGKAARGDRGNDSDADVDADRARWRLGSPLAAAACFAAASLARSNGLINAGYLCHHALEGAVGEWQQGAGAVGVGARRKRARAAAAACRRLAVGALLSALVGAPLLAMQAHGYAAFCCAPVSTGHAHPLPGSAGGGSSIGGDGGVGISGESGGLSLLLDVFRPLASWASGRGLCAAAATRATAPHDPGTLGGPPSPLRPWCAERVPRIYSFVQVMYEQYISARVTLLTLALSPS
jgi:hypothetical protein